MRKIQLLMIYLQKKLISPRVLSSNIPEESATSYAVYFSCHKLKLSDSCMEIFELNAKNFKWLNIWHTIKGHLSMQTEVKILSNIDHETHSMTRVLPRMVTCSERRVKLLYCMNSETISNLKIVFTNLSC